MQQAKPTYSEVKDHYEKLRGISRQAAHKVLEKVIRNKRGQPILKDEIALKGLDMNSTIALKKYELSSKRRVDWDWVGRKGVQDKYKNHPKRFELAIWHRELTLCGASIGAPTWSGHRLRLDYIESNPEGSPLDGTVTDICIVAATAYANLINASQIRIMNPVNDRVKNHYLSKYGFKYDTTGNYCFRDL